MTAQNPGETSKVIHLVIYPVLNGTTPLWFPVSIPTGNHKNAYSHGERTDNEGTLVGLVSQCGAPRFHGTENEYGDEP